MKFNELSTNKLMDINGGYSWNEFKKDVSNTIESVGKVVDKVVSVGPPASTPENPWMR